MPANGQLQNNNYGQLRRSQAPPRFNNRLNPAPMNLPAPIAGMHEGGVDGNRRMYRVPQPQINERIYMKQGPQIHQNPQNNQKRYQESYGDQNNNLGGGYQDFELHKNPPPQLPTKSVEVEVDPNNSSVLEPVVTLQMMQSKKGSNKVNLPAPSKPIQSVPPTQQKPQEPVDGKSPVYVVYPDPALNFPYHKENGAPSTAQLSGNYHNVEESAVEINNHDIGDQITSSVSEYQNTPFSVVSHFEQEPLLMAKNKNNKNNKSPFPYHFMERPQHIENGHYPNQQEKSKLVSDSNEYNIGEEPVNIKSRIINDKHNEMVIGAKLTRFTDKPIALAYTPTIPNQPYSTTPNYYNYQHPHHQYDKFDDKFSMPNYGGPVISEILDDKQTPYDDYYHQKPREEFQHEHYDFQAPFEASMNLGNEVTTVHHGWAVITPSPYSKGSENNKIDRLDLNLSETQDESVVVETTTRKFDLNQFQPEYLSGFMPIHTAGSNPILPSNSAQIVMTTTEKQPSSTVTSTTARTTSTTTTTTVAPIKEIPIADKKPDKIIQKIEENKKKVEIDSLEAFFDQLTRDYDADADADLSKENETETKINTTNSSENSSI